MWKSNGKIHKSASQLIKHDPDVDDTVRPHSRLSYLHWCHAFIFKGGVLGTAVVLAACCEGRGRMQGKLGRETESLASRSREVPGGTGLIDFFPKRWRGCLWIPKSLFKSHILSQVFQIQEVRFYGQIFSVYHKMQSCLESESLGTKLTFRVGWGNSISERIWDKVISSLRVME